MRSDSKEWEDLEEKAGKNIENVTSKDRYGRNLTFLGMLRLLTESSPMSRP